MPVTASPCDHLRWHLVPLVRVLRGLYRICHNSCRQKILLGPWYMNSEANC
jgi:hypothetical protein